MASLKTYTVTCTNLGTAYNVVTNAITTPPLPNKTINKGVEVTFQNTHATAKVSVGGTDVFTLAGIVMGTQFSTYQVGKRDAPAAIQLEDWWVSSDTAGAVVTVQLLKAV